MLKNAGANVARKSSNLQDLRLASRLADSQQGLNPDSHKNELRSLGMSILPDRHFDFNL